MSEGRKRTLSVMLTLSLVAANLVAFNALLAHWRTARLDLTQEHLYTISPATERLLASLDEDVVIHGYFSRRTHPKLAPLVPQVVDLLEEYRLLSGGRVEVEIVDPRNDEDLEQEARSRFGVESTPFRLASKYEAGIVNAYFSLVIQQGDQYVRYGFDDLIRVEPLPDGDIDVRFRNLEYDLTRGIKKVVYGFRAGSELFERVDGVARLTMIATPDSLPEVLRGVPQAVRDAAAQLEAVGGDRFEFEEIDPGRDEAQAAELYQRFGARPMTLGLLGDTEFYLYGYLQIGDRIEQLDLAAEDVSAAGVREAVEDSLRRQVPGFLKTVGVVSPDADIPPELMMQMQMQGRMPDIPREFQQIQTLLERDYAVRAVSLDEAVPSAVDVLLVLRPQGLGDEEVFHLDQYLMRGGRVILCAGRYRAELGANGLDVSPVESGLDAWLAHFGLIVEPTLVLDERNQPFPVPEIRQTVLGAMRTWRLEPYPYLVEVRDDGFVNEEVAGSLQAMGLYWTSPVTLDAEAVPDDLTAVELLRSSPESWTDDDVTQTAYVDHVPPAVGVEPHPLAWALGGRFDSYFADREPPQATGTEDEAARERVVLKRSPETRMVVIGNADFLSDFISRALGTQEGGFFVENLTFMQNVIDWISLDADMIEIRSRDAAVRRLPPLPKPREIAIEVANYLVPLVLLVAFGLWRWWRRRDTGSRPMPGRVAP